MKKQLKTITVYPSLMIAWIPYMVRSCSLFWIYAGDIFNCPFMLIHGTNHRSVHGLAVSSGHDYPKVFAQCQLSSEVLPYPSPDRLMILDCDASGTQIAAELSQVQDGVIRPICYASHVLMKEHRSYCTTRKE